MTYDKAINELQSAVDDAVRPEREVSFNQYQRICDAISALRAFTPPADRAEDNGPFPLPGETFNEYFDRSKAWVDAARHETQREVAQPSAGDAVPDGWQLVPKELTKMMVRAAAETPGMRAIDASSQTMQARGYPLDPKAFEDGSPLQQAWRAMLAAAPKPKP